MGELISVVIPSVKGRERLLERAVNSVRSQTYKNFEIIVVKEGKPAQEQRDIGVKRARGNLIAFLDDDDYWLPTKLEKEYRYMMEQELDFVACGYFDESEGVERIPSAKNYKDLLFSFSSLETSTVLFKKELYQKVGGVDFRFKSEQNHDLFYRFSKYGKFGYVPEILVVKGKTDHHIGGNPLNKLQGYVLFHWKYKKDILGEGVGFASLMLLKFFITILLMIFARKKLNLLYRLFLNEIKNKIKI